MQNNAVLGAWQQSDLGKAGFLSLDCKDTAKL